MLVDEPGNSLFFQCLSGRQRPYITVSRFGPSYVYAPSREGGLVYSLLKDFKGVVVSDFYAAYDALDCPQQKCLIHLIRDPVSDLQV